MTISALRIFLRVIEQCLLRQCPGVAKLDKASGRPRCAPASCARLPPQRGAELVPTHTLWAVLIARICEAFPLVCPLCGGNMRILAFMTEGVQIRQILEHIGVDTRAPRIAPARGPPLWGACDAQGADGAGQGAPIDPDRGESAQTAPEDVFDQRAGQLREFVISS